MKRKIFSIILFYLLSSVFIVFFNWVKFDILIPIRGGLSFGAELVFGFFVTLVNILYLIIAVVSIIRIAFRFKSEKWKAFVPAFIVAITCFVYLYIPMTRTYMKLDYMYNLECRNEIIDMVKSGKISDYQINTDQYMVPYRLASYTKTMFVERKAGSVKVLFYIYRGLTKCRVLVYDSDDGGITPSDFSPTPDYEWGFKEMNKIAANWYTATLHELE